MNRIGFLAWPCAGIILVLLCALFAVGCTASPDILEWSELPELPAPPDGKEQIGLAGVFVGTSNGALIVAGGTNFPEGPPWEGGEKVWHDDIYVLEKTADGQYKWYTGFKLPYGVANGSSISTDLGLLCIGGSDVNFSYTGVLLLTWDPEGKVVNVKVHSNLPKPLGFTSATRIGDTIYVAGGHSSPKVVIALNVFWSFDLSSDARWQVLPSWDGPPRLLAVLAAQHDGTSEKVFLFSGRNENPISGSARYRDVHRYDPATQTWTQMKDAPRCLMAGTGVAYGENKILLIGGDDARYWGQELGDNHPGFPKDMLYLYDTAADTWTQAGTLPQNQVATLAVEWDDALVIPSGEVRPGVSTPKVWRAKP